MTEKQQQRRATTDSTSSDFSIVVEIPTAVPATSSTSTALTSSTKDVLPMGGQQTPMKAATTSAQQAVGGEENRPTFDELQSIERHRREILLRVSCIIVYVN